MNTTDIANVSSWIEAHQDEIVQTLAALVQIPSVIGNEAPAQAFMRQHYEQAKLEIGTKIFAPSLHPKLFYHMVGSASAQVDPFLCL